MSRILHANVGVVDPVFPYVPNDFGFHATGDPTPFLRNLVCKIAGIDRSGFVRADSLKGTLQLEGRDDLRFELIDTTDTYRPLLAEPVEVTSNTNLLFRGTIVDLAESYDINEDRNVRHIDVRVAGAGHALDRRLVFGEAEANSLFSVLVQILQPSGVHDDIWGFYDFVPFPGPTVETQRANGSTALQYVQRAVNAAGDGWTWWLDWNGNYPQLHVRDLSTDPIDAPWDATDSSDNILTVEGVDRDDSEYANRVYVRMGSEAVSTVSETFVGGTLSEDIYALDYVPLEMISITVDDVSQTFGIKSLLWDTGDDTSLEWYYQPIGEAWFQNQIWRGPEQAAVPGGAIIEVTYRAQTGSYVRADDTTEQTARAALMGFGSGIVEKILEVKDIADEDAAQQYAVAMLAKLKTVPTVVRYTSFRHGVKPGQTQTITLSKHGVDGEFNISSVRFRELAGSYEGSEVGIEYEIEATSGTRAVPHPLRLHEDIIDAVRGAQEAARTSGGTGGGGAGGLGTGSIVWERPRGVVDGTNDTFFTTYVPQLLETENRSIIVIRAGQILYPFTDTDYTVTVDEGKFVYPSALIPKTGDDHHVIYLKRGGQSIGNQALVARKFAGGTDIINYGAETVFAITGDVSCAIWVRFSSSTVTDGILMQYGDSDLNHAWMIKVVGSSDNWQIMWRHDFDTPINSQEELTFSPIFKNDVWYYVGASRDDTLKQVRLYSGTEPNDVELSSASLYIHSANSLDTVNSEMTVGNQLSGTAGGVPFKGIAQEHYVWSRTTTLADHRLAAAGSPSSTNLILSLRLLGNSPEQDESPTGASGAVTGTTTVPGRI